MTKDASKREDPTTDSVITILLVGPLGTEIGGTTVSFRHLLQYTSSRSDVISLVVGTQGLRGRGLFAIPRFLKLLSTIWRLAKTSDVISVHTSIGAVPIIGIPLLVICRLRSKPLVFRLFGGLDHTGLSGVSRRAALFFFKRCDAYLAQTKKMTAQAQLDGIPSTFWYPTSRPYTAHPPPEAVGKCNRFVFVGQLRIEKGLNELGTAMTAQSPGVTLDIYGPWHNLPRNSLQGHKNITYKGVLAPDEVVGTLRQYDALILPSYLPAEGYSGVILEAYSAGKPVIATRWNALPEIVIHEHTGLLVIPKCPNSLAEAIIRLSKDYELYKRLSAEAFAFGRRFSVESLGSQHITLCKEVVRKRNKKNARSISICSSIQNF